MTEFALTNRTSKRHVQGAHRARVPDETLAELTPHLQSMGITRVAVITGLDHIGIPVVAVTRPNARCISVTQGKGPTLAAAKVSGIMEAVEHHHAERVTQPLVLANLEELGPRRRPVNPDLLPRYVREFHAHRRVLWIEGVELLSRDSLWIPYDLVHLDFSLPLTASGCFLMGSSGLASGNNVLEAACHGIHELIERDAVTLFYLRNPEEQWARRVDPASVDDATCRDLLASYDDAGVAVAIWDATSDVGVACFLCTVLDRHQSPFRPIGAASGAGCHLNRGVALARALSEAAQSRLTRIAGARDDLGATELAELRSPDARARSLSQIEVHGPLRSQFANVPSVHRDTFEGDLACLYERLVAVGLPQIVGVDLSLPSLPVHVVRMVIPGLEGFSEIPGYQPGPRALALTRASGAGHSKSSRLVP